MPLWQTGWAAGSLFHSCKASGHTVTARQAPLIRCRSLNLVAVGMRIQPRGATARAKWRSAESRNLSLEPLEDQDGLVRIGLTRDRRDQLPALFAEGVEQRSMHRPVKAGSQQPTHAPLAGDASPRLP